ncbi:restin homolog [Dunckerocampus dactyliophorus]|uniref:restin homolog n=1 Tax=Dunckerocampus dactyliophorus TaxID=161453 RepID=UPI0024058F3C|nr:restin homolog [Dunckerocampus dactyliophorus]
MDMANNDDLKAQIRVSMESNPLDPQHMALIDQVSQLKQHKNNMETEIADLRTQVKVNKENEDTLIKVNLLLKNEVAQLKSQSLKTEKMETQCSNLKAQVEFNREKEEALIKHNKDDQRSETQERKKDELRIQVKSLHENNNQLYDDVKSLTDKLSLLQAQKAKTETHNCDLRAKVKALQENKNQFDDEMKSLSDQLALLQSQKAKLETQNGDLRAQVKALQENEDILIKQNEFLNDEVSQLERWNVRTDKQNENLRTRVKALRENENILSEKMENMMADLSHFENQRDKDQSEIYGLRTELQTLRCQLQDQDELLRRIDHAESLMEKEWAENERLKNKLSELEEEGNFVKKQNDIVRVELENHKSLQDQQSEQIVQLKSKLKDQKVQLEDAQFLLYSKDDELAKQNRRIVYLNEVTDELNSLLSSFKQRIHDLQTQLELRQMDEILTASDSCGSLMETANEEESVSEDEQELSNAETRDTSPQMKYPHQNSNRFTDQKRLVMRSLSLHDSPTLKMETENEELRTQVKELEENKIRLAEQNRQLNEMMAHLESQSANADKHGDLTPQVEDRQESEDKLTEQNQLFSEKLTELESWNLKMETENGDLKVQVEDLKENEKLTKQRTETLMADLSHCESQRDKYKAESNRLRMEVQTLRSQLQDESDLRRRIDHAESQMEKKWAENDKLSDRLRELEEKDDSLKKQHDIVRAQLEEHKSVRDQQQQQIAQLMAALEDNKLQVKKAGFLLYGKEDEPARTQPDCK